METQDLAKRVKELRAIRGMSQEYLGEEARVSLRTIQRIENNESEPTGETIKRIANALEVPLNELIGPNLGTETSDLKATMVFLKKQLSKTNKKSEIKTFEMFISLLKKLKEKDLSNEQQEGIEGYIQYLELEKIPSFSNEIYKEKLTKFKKYLKNNIGFVPVNFYTTWIASFVISFTVAFIVQKNIDYSIKIGVTSIALILIGIGMVMDLRIRRQNRSFNF
ncbi:MAG: helix-turn-helix transcriptional regulator [Bacteroidota bacterium]